MSEVRAQYFRRYDASGSMENSKGRVKKRAGGKTEIRGGELNKDIVAWSREAGLLGSSW